MNFNEIEQFMFNNENKWLKNYWDNSKINPDYNKFVETTLKKEAKMVLNTEQVNNLKAFSQGKVKNLENLLLDVKKSSNTYAEFVEKGKEVINLHTEHLKVEVKSVNTAAEQMKEWNNIVKDKDKYIEWVTSNDDKVRDEHRALDGLTLKVNDPFWNKQFPGRDWNCRCTHKIVRKPNKTDIPTNLDNPTDTGLVVNPGKTGLFFNKNHTYLK